jgi:O-methyltransferase
VQIFKDFRYLQILKELRDVTAQFRAAGMQVTPEQGQFMAMLVKLTGAKHYLEIGVFTGYSLISAALALPPDGKAVALDRDPRALEVARQFVEKAQVSSKVDIRQGPAMDSLQDVRSEYGEDQFDLVFIGALPHYFIRQCFCEDLVHVHLATEILMCRCGQEGIQEVL